MKKVLLIISFCLLSISIVLLIRNNMIQKDQQIEALQLYGNNDNQPNGKLICYRIHGDLVSSLGTHCGNIIEYIATINTRTNHAGKHGTILDPLNPEYNSLEKAKILLTYVGGYLAGSIVSLSEFNYYYSYYTPMSFIEYMWITHETDSFLYYLHQGDRI